MVDDQVRSEWVNVSSGTGSPGKRAVKSVRVCVCVCVCVCARVHVHACVRVHV